MIDAIANEFLGWLGTYALHSTALLGGVIVFERLRTSASPALRETLWRIALLASIATATLHTSGLVPSTFGSFEFAIDSGVTNLTAPGAETSTTQSGLDSVPAADRPAPIRATVGESSAASSAAADSLGPADFSRSPVITSANLTSADLLYLLIGCWLAAAALAEYTDAIRSTCAATPAARPPPRRDAKGHRKDP